jgi:cytochrome c oxidase cbb3-type subunit 3
MSGFWSLYVIVLVVINFVGALWLLQALSKREVAGDEEATDHIWDEDLREYNSPLPRWWLWLFWISAVFMVVYLIIFPGLGNFSGVLGWSQVGQYQQEVSAADTRYGDIFNAFNGVSLTEMSADPDAVRLGRNLFLNNCTGCHGSDGRGARGYPNLTDGVWLYGGEPEAIQLSITNGRTGVMPAWGAVLGEEGTDQVVAYVLSLSGRADADSALLASGQQKFVQFCSACHGADGQGVKALGGANLTDDDWLHGSRETDIRDVINNGRANQMPAQANLLSEDRIRTLVAYVLSLSGDRAN